MILNAQIVAAIVRHILTGVAGGMAVKYGVDGVTVDAIVGGAAALAGVGWSLLDKRKQ
jgi:phage shock protein PspC (stress-responsive transcriptional regulator)